MSLALEVDLFLEMALGLFYLLMLLIFLDD